MERGALTEPRARNPRFGAALPHQVSGIEFLRKQEWGWVGMGLTIAEKL